MKVWWCEEHNWNGWPDEDVCLWGRGKREQGLPLSTCRMVEMQLVPADALIIQKENGEWPTLLVMELADLLAYQRPDDDAVEYREARRFLDDLSAASVSDPFKATT